MNCGRAGDRVFPYVSDGSNLTGSYFSIYFTVLYSNSFPPIPEN